MRYIYIYIYICIYYIYVSQYIAEWCLSIVVYRSVTVSIAEGVTESDLYVKPTDSHQYLLSSSSYPFYCKKDMQYSQALRLNRICSDNGFFDKKCNDLVKYLLERGYSKEVVRKEILRATAIPRDALIENQEK